MTVGRALSRPIRKQSLCRGFATSAACQADFTHAVIGGGAVGLGIARKLASQEGTSTVLIERHGHVGTETSSRNSEVIHAGLYYGADSLKTKLCIQGKNMMYELCDKYNIPYKRTSKWIVAQTNEQWEELVKVHKFARTVDVPTHFVSLSEAADLEPFIQAKVGILESPTTGIIDSHSYMQFLLGDFTDKGGDVAYQSTVTGIEPLGSPAGSEGYRITTKDGTSGEESTFEAETLINSAGLGAIAINNLLWPDASHPKHREAYFAKGNYFSYNGSTPKASRLVYPAPEPGAGGLGTHLTMDIAGQLRFGPDVEWVDGPNDLSVNSSRLHDAVNEIKKYMPAIDESKLHPDYAGIRPKLGKGSAVVSGKGFNDFYIKDEGKPEDVAGGGEGFKGFVNLLGIESPGLTSSLAIAEEVHRLLYR